jgi:hypothetical protein
VERQADIEQTGRGTTRWRDRLSEKQVDGDKLVRESGCRDRLVEGPTGGRTG